MPFPPLPFQGNPERGTGVAPDGQGRRWCFRKYAATIEQSDECQGEPDRNGDEHPEIALGPAGHLCPDPSWSRPLTAARPPDEGSLSELLLAGQTIRSPVEALSSPALQVRAPLRRVGGGVLMIAPKLDDVET